MVLRDIPGHRIDKALQVAFRNTVDNTLQRAIIAQPARLGVVRHDHIMAGGPAASLPRPNLA